ncbi:MAG: hypothetical protein JGK30_00930 [Microcoleus sp. PH2017_40_RAT_O_B]|uniref:hypothetical protein n=1 Tax=unclassified Microcoleus TaxID=2642155 RepID=UPI001DDC9D65|nr:MULTISPECIES: hypothetical protein [unclassified Microcoleus]MCC3465561.1 hypothetical protein [Microcoleus sp. PH2017_06_SFM_O_A]MCC3435071.1 hypothetical protein [Microcoleus sp. PH2017_05_CCC_O_A]MCC3489495.1 hypothetical protein [Microcoleus sp. PH2017_16_JOR_D_A]MCC3570610.1 hypothetical protein [Microcoleus sp. PH2017_34_RAT_O_A]MCC3591185.1 hypothetical protein [Microcoleus sp. PH2017_28_MFU_U_A]
MIDTLLCICEPSCCRPQLGLLKAEPQGALYFTGRGRDRRQAIDNCCTGQSILDFPFFDLRLKLPPTEGDRSF